jgi:OHCU decarboxylase
MNLNKLNQESLLACCGSLAWINHMLALLPVPIGERSHELAESIWCPSNLRIVRSFRAHPQIGQQGVDKQASSKWSALEQARMSTASQQTARVMANLNAAYRQTFGFVFIVCATGRKCATEHELCVAADEHARIMHLILFHQCCKTQVRLKLGIR